MVHNMSITELQRLFNKSRFKGAEHVCSLLTYLSAGKQNIVVIGGSESGKTRFILALEAASRQENVLRFVASGDEDFAKYFNTMKTTHVQGFVEHHAKTAESFVEAAANCLIAGSGVEKDEKLYEELTDVFPFVVSLRRFEDGTFSVVRIDELVLDKSLRVTTNPIVQLNEEEACYQFPDGFTWRTYKRLKQNLTAVGLDDFVPFIDSVYAPR